MASAEAAPLQALDLCAGAGGKTLALAAMLPPESTIIAADTDRGRLSRIEPRKRRARANNVETILLAPGKERNAMNTVNSVKSQNRVPVAVKAIRSLVPVTHTGETARK